MKRNIITDSQSFPIQPLDVNIRHCKGFADFSGVFGDVDSGHSAYWIIKLCQRLHRWGPFTLEEMENLFAKAGHKDFKFYRLINPKSLFDNPATNGWIVHDTDKQYHVTDDFVRLCHKASPARRKKSKCH